MIKTFFRLVIVVVGFITLMGMNPISELNEHRVENTNWVNYNDTTRKENRITLNGTAIEKNARLINLKFDKAQKTIQLNSTELIEDDAPASGQPEGYDTCCGTVAWIEDLRKEIVVKKILNIENPSAISARIVFSGLEVPGNTSPLYLSLNGEKMVRPASKIAYPKARQYFDPAMSWDHWYFVNIPANKLRKGNNEILLWTETNSTFWRILVAHEKEFRRGSLNRTSPNRSMKSRDAGKTWSDSKLGALNAIDGEYSVRLSLDRYQSSGEYVSPVIDIVNGENPFKINSSKAKVSFGAEFQMPPQTSTKAFVRFGASPDIDDNSWTGWQALENAKEYALANKYYMQWRAEVKSIT